MAGAARVHIVEKGRDPRRYAMVAMGGGGGPFTRRASLASWGCARWWCRPRPGPPRRSASWSPRSPTRAARSWPMRLAAPDFARRRDAAPRAGGGRTGTPRGRRNRRRRGGGVAPQAGRPETRLSRSRRGDDGAGVGVQRLADMRLPRPDASDLDPASRRTPLARESPRGHRVVRRRVPAPLYPPLRGSGDRGAELAGGVHRAGAGSLCPALGRRGRRWKRWRKCRRRCWRRRSRRRWRKHPRRPSRPRRGSGRRLRGRRQGPPPGLGAGARCLRRSGGLRPVRDGRRVRGRGARDRRGTGGDDRRARRLHPHRGRGG